VLPTAAKIIGAIEGTLSVFDVHIGSCTGMIRMLIVGYCYCIRHIWRRC
jgi:hypothetical protein